MQETVGRRSSFWPTRSCCRRYLTCQETDEEPLSQRCRNGESFDSLLGFCRQNDGTCLMENGQRVGECSGKHGQLARDPKSCRNYFVCINGQKIAQSCKDDEYFSKSQNMCLPDTEHVCNPTQQPEEPNKQSCAGLSEFILYPYVNDCSKRRAWKLAPQQIMELPYANVDNECRSFYICHAKW
ncbi:hypothetical protein DOY81_013555 [Sarcophaga bullata]|nr:hypothetical protein DOY81_013555 [Sarcophaga bullata]